MILGSLKPAKIKAYEKIHFKIRSHVRHTHFRFHGC